MNAPLALLLLFSFSIASADLSSNDLPAIEKIIGLEFSDQERALMLPGVRRHSEDYQSLRSLGISNSVPPAVLFNPLPIGFEPPGAGKFKWRPPAQVHLPTPRDGLAFYSVGELSVLIKNRKITSVELTRIFLARLKKFGPGLHCIVTVTEDLALEQARFADAEIAAGKYRGPLHGIPYGAKDLLATKGIPTTWGASPFTNQVFDFNATVIDRLQKAGAVLIAKTALGEIAMGDVWFGGKSRNPWNPTNGSSGSSAGSAAGLAAGLFPFAIGSETWGSIISPSTVCGITGLRPTYGRVSRHGAMALSWSMDKLGPMARTADDTMLVLKAIAGPDGLDQMVIPAGLDYRQRKNLKGLKVGILPSKPGKTNLHSEQFKAFLPEHGAELIPVTLPDFPIHRMVFVLDVEAAAAFESLTRSNQDDQLVQQGRGSWPNILRKARLIPAVEYLQAQRARHLLIQATAQLFTKIDCLLAAPNWEDDPTLLGNLTGHPAVVFPCGRNEQGAPPTITLLGRLFEEGTICSIAAFYQQKTEFHLLHPPDFK